MTTSRVQLRVERDRPGGGDPVLQRLLRCRPAKERAGYANFAIADPPLKLVLFENPTRRRRSTTSASRLPALTT